MIINEETNIIYHIYDESNNPIEEFDTRELANAYIDYKTSQGVDTVLWSVIPEPHYNGD